METQSSFKKTTVKKLTELEISKMSEKQLQEQYIKYLQQRLLRMDDKVIDILFFYSNLSGSV